MYKNELAYHISFVLALAPLVYSKMANNNFYQGSYDQYSAFADGQVFLDEEGNAVYQLRPDGSPHLIPAGGQSPYQDAQSPGVYSPGFDLGKLEDYGPLALNEVTFNDLADMDRLDALMKETEDEGMAGDDTIPYVQGSQVVLLAHESMPIANTNNSSPYAPQNGANTVHQATTAHPPTISQLTTAVAHGMQLAETSVKDVHNLPKPRPYKIRTVEQRAKEEKKRAANYLAVRKNRLTAAERYPALLQRLYFLEKVMEHFRINICPTKLGLPQGYGSLKFIPTTCEEKKLNLP